MLDKSNRFPPLKLHSLSHPHKAMIENNLTLVVKCICFDKQVKLVRPIRVVGIQYKTQATKSSYYLLIASLHYDLSLFDNESTFLNGPIKSRKWAAAFSKAFL